MAPTPVNKLDKPATNLWIGDQWRSINPTLEHQLAPNTFKMPLPSKESEAAWAASTSNCSIADSSHMVQPPTDVLNHNVERQIISATNDHANSQALRSTLIASGAFAPPTANIPKSQPYTVAGDTLNAPPTTAGFAPLSNFNPTAPIYSPAAVGYASSSSTHRYQGWGYSATAGHGFVPYSGTTPWKWQRAQRGTKPQLTDAQKQAKKAQSRAKTQRFANTHLTRINERKSTAEAEKVAGGNEDEASRQTESVKRAAEAKLAGELRRALDAVMAVPTEELKHKIEGFAEQGQSSEDHEVTEYHMLKDLLEASMPADDSPPHYSWGVIGQGRFKGKGLAI